jgi:hypothetical protein
MNAGYLMAWLAGFALCLTQMSIDLITLEMFRHITPSTPTMTIA